MEMDQTKPNKLKTIKGTQIQWIISLVWILMAFRVFIKKDIYLSFRRSVTCTFVLLLFHVTIGLIYVKIKKAMEYIHRFFNYIINHRYDAEGSAISQTKLNVFP